MWFTPPYWQLRHLCRWSLMAVVALYLVAVLACCAPTAAHAQARPVPPPDAQQYRLALRQQAHLVWGLAAPVAVFAAQIHQESRWRPDAQSPVGAQGLAQFMPSTARWIGGLDTSLAERAPTSPTWAIRALVTYDQWLWARITTAADDCQRMAYALSAYNGGLGWVYKRQKAAPNLGHDPGVCLGDTCSINPGISPAAQRENEAYPHRILLVIGPAYATWGPGVGCTQ